MAKSKSELTRMNMYLPTPLVERVKSYASELGLNTTSAIIVLLNQGLMQGEMMKQLPVIQNIYNDLKSNNLIDQKKEDTSEKLI